MISGEANWFGYAEWLTLKYASSVKGTIVPEKPLSFKHWADSFTTIAVPYGFYTTFLLKSLPKVIWPTVANPLSDPRYTSKVLTQMQRDAFHGFPRLVDTMATGMDITTFIGD